MMVHRLPVDAFLVEFLAIGGHRVHRLVSGDLEVVLRQVVGTTMSSGRRKKINRSNKVAILVDFNLKRRNGIQFR